MVIDLPVQQLWGKIIKMAGEIGRESFPKIRASRTVRVAGAAVGAAGAIAAGLGISSKAGLLGGEASPDTGDGSTTAQGLDSLPKNPNIVPIGETAVATKTVQAEQEVPGVDIIFASRVIDSVNTMRREQNLPELRLNQSLTAFAEEDARLIWENGGNGTIDEAKYKELQGKLPNRDKQTDYQGTIKRSWSGGGTVPDLTPEDITGIFDETSTQSAFKSADVKDIGIGCVVERKMSDKGNYVTHYVVVVNLGSPGTGK